MSPFETFQNLVREHQPRVALVLGSGMGDVGERLEDPRFIPFREVPGLEAPTVAGHKGALILGRWAGVPVLVFSGRLHFYEGHAWRKVVEPVHIAKFLGAQILLLTNATGGIRRDLRPGDLVLLNDHLEWTRPAWWRHPGPGTLGGARPSPYSERLIRLLQQAGRQRGLALTTGLYAQLTGPSYETRAEIRALKGLGADVVGMSTAREIQTGHDLGLECAAISCITNHACGLNEGPIHHEEVLTIMAQVREVLAGVVEEFLGKLKQ